MVNVEIQGKVYAPTAPYLVGREKVREFARAVMSEAAVHHNPEAARAAGYSDVIAPPTFAIVVQDATLQQLLADDEAAVDFSRVVHGDQRFTYSRPIVAGDELTGVMTITSVKQLGGNSMVTSSTEITDAEGAHVVTAISTLVVRAEEPEAQAAETTAQTAETTAQAAETATQTTQTATRQKTAQQETA